MQAADIQRMIQEALPNAEVLVRGDDGVHFEAVVVSPDFAGKSLIAQHRLVNAALGERLQREEIHALGLRTFTPESWAAQQAQA